jgi:hypothetical protein
MTWAFAGGVSREYIGWLADHRGDYVLIVTPDFGPGGGPGRLPDGTLDHGPVKGVSKVLHRATCEDARSPGLYDTSICGPYEEFTRDLSKGDTVDCPVCRPLSPRPSVACVPVCTRIPAAPSR